MASIQPDGSVVETPEKPNARAAALEQMNRVFGDSGTRRYSGYFMEEYNPDWRDESRVDNVESMRRGDAAVRAALRAVKAPLLAAKWSVTTVGQSPKDEAMRLFVEQTLFHMNRTWTDFLREALGYLDFGHYVFELVWQKRDGKIVLADLEPRIPRSIAFWKMQDNQPGITQYIQTSDRKQSMASIPMEKLLVLTNDKEGDDVTGMSILRSAWKHYSLKEVLYKIQGIAAERYGVGIPVVKLSDGASDDDKEAAEDIAGNLRSNEKGYVVLPNKDWDLQILTPNGNPQGQAIADAIDHHNRAIMFSVLASFMSLGSDGVGSLALSRDQSSFFLKAVEDMARYFTEQMNMQIVRRLVDVNFGPQQTYPELRFSPLGDIDYAEYGTALGTLAQNGLIKVDGRLMQYVHGAFDLPDIPAEELEAIKEREIADQVGELEPDDDGEAAQ